MGMTQVLIVGKGGVGKTTLASALGRTLAARGQRVLLIEADADGTLGMILGAADRLTVGVLKQTLKEDRDRVVPDLHPLLAPVAAGLDLLRVGHSDGPGCYCGPNNLLRQGLQPLLTEYDWVIADSHAGTEFISRAVMTPDVVLVVQRGEHGDPSQVVARTNIHPALDRLGMEAARIEVYMGGQPTATDEGIWLPDLGRVVMLDETQGEQLAGPVLDGLAAHHGQTV